MGAHRREVGDPAGAFGLTLGGLLLHMALVEDSWLDHRFFGNKEIDMWADVNWDDDPDWEFRVAADWSHADLLAQFDTSVARSRTAVASAESLDQMAVHTRPDGTEWNLRWILVHMIEEYARHCGHADYIRESIDGTTGD